MNLSNTLYFNQATTPSDTPSVSLTPSDTHTVEYLNVPTAGYHSPRRDRKHICLTHPTLNLEFKMTEEEYIEMTFKAHWAEALLVISDEGKVHEFNPETMTVEQRVPIESFEHRLIREKKHTASNYEATWVDKLNHKTRRAQLLTLTQGHVARATVSFNELQAKWCIEPGNPSSTTIELWRAAKNASAWLGIPRTPVQLSMKDHGLVLDVDNFCCAEFAATIQEANQLGTPILYALPVSKHNPLWQTPEVRVYEVNTAMPPLPLHIYGRMLIPTSVLAKQLSSLPIETYSGWESTVVAQQNNLKQLSSAKGGYRLDIAHKTAELIASRRTMAFLTTLAGKLTWVTAYLASGVDTKGQFFISRKLYVYSPTPMTYEQQVPLIEALKGLFISTESLESATEPQPDVSLNKVQVSSHIACGSSPEEIEAKHQELFQAIEGYAALALSYGYPSILQNGTMQDMHAIRVPLLKLEMSETLDSVQAAVEAHLSRTK